MADNIQKTLDIKVNYSEALEGVAKYRMELDRAKAEAKLMTEELKNHAKQLNEGKISEEQYTKAVMETQKQLAANKQEQNQLSDAIRTSEKVIKNQITQQNEAEDSLKAMRAQLSNLTKEYDSLSGAQRENEQVGGALMNSINDLTGKLKEAEEATQRYYRNVGNYSNSVQDALQKMGMSGQASMTQIISTGNSTVDAFMDMATGAEGLKGAMATAGTAVSGLAKQLMALIATPVGAVIFAVAAAFLALKNGIQSSEERMNKFRTIVAPLQGILDGVSIVLGKVCATLLNFVEIATSGIAVVAKLAEKLPLIGGAMEEANRKTEEYINIERQRQEITKATRDEVVKSAEREREISNLRAKFTEKDKYSNEERLKFLEQAIAKEKEQAEANKRLAQMRLENLQREAALADNDAEMNDKLAQAKAEVIKADTELSNKMRELNAQRVEAINGINAEVAAEKKAAEEKAKAWREAQKRKEEEQKQALNTEEQLWREYEDALLDLIKDGYEKQKQVVATQYQREIEDLKKRLKEEENLTVSARDAINKLIIAKQKEMNQQIAEIDKQATDEQIQRDAERLQKKADTEKLNLENRLASVMEGTEEFFNLRKQQIDLEYKQEADRLKALHEQELAAIDALDVSEEEKNQMRLEQKAWYDEQMRSLGIKRNEAEAKLAEDRKKIVSAETQMKLAAYNALKSGIDAMAQHSKAFAIMSKTIALAEIAINTGKAIAAGVSQAMSVPFPANLVAIATTVATVLANVASAISTVKSAKFAKGGRVDTRQYASGGDVRGAGTGTSDSIHAMLSNGESVMTAAATSMYAPVLSAMNQSAGGNPITGGGSAQGEDMLARAVARGLMAMPNPVVSVEEINTTARRVQVLENLASV